MNIQDAIDVIESVSGFTDESTPVGEAWAEVLSFIHRRPTVQPLSPAAQAVLDAAGDSEPGIYEAIVAALRAAANQVKHEFPLSPEYTEWDSGHDAGIYRALNKFLAIAAELDGTTPYES